MGLIAGAADSVPAILLCMNNKWLTLHVALLHDSATAGVHPMHEPPSPMLVILAALDLLE